MLKHNYKISLKFYRIMILVIPVLLLVACDRNRNHPGWDYFPDMFYSTAYETYTANPNFKDSMTMRMPVPGTIHQDYNPFEYTIDPEERIRAGKEVLNPLVPSAEIPGKGGKLYAIYCSGCHGIKGAGDGKLFTAKLYPVVPRSLVNETAVKLKDGEIFHTITLGFGSMGAHGSQISEEDRWKVILHVRKLQEENNKEN